MFKAKIILIFLLIFSLDRISAFQDIDDDKCDDQLNAFTNALKENKFWAWRLFDLWGKLQPGLLYGNLASYGSFDGCLKFTESTEEVGVIKGQYCLVSWKPKMKDKVSDQGDRLDKFVEFLTLSTGVCLPSACSPEKVLKVVNELLNPVQLEAVGIRCQTDDPLPLDGFDIAAIATVSIVGTLMFLSTAYDLLVRRSKDREPNKLFVAFSVYTNGQSLFKIDQEKSSKRFAAADGLKCVAIFVVPWVHRYALQLIMPTTNIYESVKRFQKIWFVTIMGPSIFLEVLLVLTGFFTAYQLLHSFKTKRFRLGQLIFHRYIRYTPAVAATMVIFTSLFRHVNGPHAEPEGSAFCHRYWWAALLHIQNYFNPNEMCLRHTWYLSVDFQMYLISPLIIFPALHYGWKYLWNVPALAILSCVCVMMTSLSHNFLPADDGSDAYTALIYVPTHARAAPWLIGMMLGYIIYDTRNREVKVNQALVWLLWILSLAAIAFSFWLYYPVSQIENNTVTVMENALIKAFSKLVFALGNAWIFFACYKLKSGGPIRWFLQLPVWQPISKIMLSFYLVGTSYLRLELQTERVPMTLEFFPIVGRYFSDVMVSLILAVTFCLAFEMPVVKVEQYFRRRPQKKIYNLAEQTTVTGQETIAFHESKLNN